MATKSLGHLSLACRTSLSSTASCNMTSANGSASACDFAQFDAVVESIAPDSTDITIEESTTLRTIYSSQGTRHAARIAIAEANFAWTEDTGGTVLALGTKIDDTIDATGVGEGTANVDMTYNDGGYNDTAAPTTTINVK